MQAARARIAYLGSSTATDGGAELRLLHMARKMRAEFEVTLFLPDQGPLFEVARAQGIEVEVAFFGARTAADLKARGYQADLMAANNVVAHVPDLNDFVEGFRILLAPTGVATFEFHHVLNLIRRNQFDTIYHEHFSYLSLGTISRIFAAAGLSIFDVEELPTHGG
ncbi:MAG: methyltransferase domain-containing protein, partial [Candidatus Omnitrophica bacterium]|nr:methyltransferase domain-containing protein [Candidatus Omnitrophota bacterium]